MIAKSTAVLAVSVVASLLAATALSCREKPKTEREEALVKQLQAGTDTERAEAADKLGRMQNVSETTVDALGQNLADPSPKVRGSAAKALENIGTEKALTELKANRDKGPEVRDAYNDSLKKLRREAGEGNKTSRSVLDAVGEALQQGGQAVKETAETQHE